LPQSSRALMPLRPIYHLDLPNWFLTATS
jgi:hypothetical protein